MIFGVIEENNKFRCKKCNEELNINAERIYNYCPFCASPLNETAKDLVLEKQKTMMYKTTIDLSHIIDDEASLEKLKKYIDKI